MYNYTSGRRESMASEEPSPSPSPFSLAFPPEIWSIVLHSFGTQPQDLVELWMTCRGVCQCFKHVVEGIFIADTLPHISLRFDITTSQGFDRNSRIEFRDYQVQTAYNCTSADRTRALFQAKDDNGAVLLKEMHDGAGSSWPSHLVDLSRPSGEVAFPGIFFHANGIVEVGWRDLFAAILAEENYYYRTNGTPAHLRFIEEHADRTVAKERTGASMVERGFREVEIFESDMSKAKQAEAPHARVFHMVIIRL